MRVLKRIVTAIAVMGLISSLGIVAVRALVLPPTACAVSEASIGAVALETNYAAVRDVLGCDGVLIESNDWGAIRHDVYRWRGDAWPFGRFEGVFYNQILHQTGKLWFNLHVTLPAAEPAR